ncbi:MAG: hypothetical protein PHX83_11935 [Acidobacteriia bacterium]|nr:hypothetical protein [Terriglobia bacterium]
MDFNEMIDSAFDKICASWEEDRRERSNFLALLCCLERTGDGCFVASKETTRKILEIQKEYNSPYFHPSTPVGGVADNVEVSRGCHDQASVCAPPSPLKEEVHNG